MVIYICSDHAGFCLKKFIIDYYSSKNPDYEFVDLGTDSSASVDYPDFAHKLANSISGFPAIAICGTGNGMAMCLNRHSGIRAGIAWTSEIASLLRRHNDANVLVLPARFIDHAEAINSIDVFLDTSFEGGRHEARVNKIDLK